MIFLRQNRSVGELSIVEVFAYFDGPRLFLAENAAGQRYLVASVDSDAETDTWLLTAISERRLLQLSEGIMDVRSVFMSPELETLYQITTNASGELMSANVLGPGDLTGDVLPEPEVFLKADFAHVAPNAAFLARSLNAAVVLLHLFPNQTRREASLKGVGKIFTSLQDYLDLKLKKALQAPETDLFQVELLGTFAGSLGVEIAVRGTDERIAPALKSAVDEFSVADERGTFADRMAAADDSEVAAIKKFMSNLKAVSSGLELEAASQRDTEPVRVTVDLPRIREAVKALTRAPSIRTETRTVTGDLVALNLRTRKFEIITLDTEETVAGVLAAPFFTEEQTAELPRRYRVVVERDIRRSAIGREETGGWRMISATKLL
jgi:hypothetical protein